MIFDPFLSLFIRAGFALLFVLTALHKFKDIGELRNIIIGYDIVSPTLARFLTPILPVGEIIVALLLVWFPEAGLIAAASMLGIYALVMAFNIARGNTQIDCGCFWGDAVEAFPTLTWSHVFRNIGLIGILVLAFVPTSARALGLLDGFNLLAGLAFGYFSTKGWFTLSAVYRRMQELGHA